MGWSPERRKQASERMKAMQEAKRAKSDRTRVSEKPASKDTGTLLPTGAMSQNSEFDNKDTKWQQQEVDTPMTTSSRELKTTSGLSGKSKEKTSTDVSYATNTPPSPQSTTPNMMEQPSTIYESAAKNASHSPRTKDSLNIDERKDGVSEDQYRDLLRRFEELEGRLRRQTPEGPQVNRRGSLVGTFEKYVVDPLNYQDPCDRLSREAKLLRVPFKSRLEQNGGYYEYDLEFKIETVRYETKDGINTQEPRFTLKLNRFLPDDEGNPTNRAYTACQMVLHEDPQAALVIARDHGVPVDSLDERSFLDEMRYLRMRDWLLEAFYPVKVHQSHEKKQMVIANKLVEVFEVTSEDPVTLDFSKLNHKL